MPNRRDFIKSVVGASAGVVFTGCELCDAMAAGRAAQAGSGAKHKPVMVGKRPVKTVDVHCHVSVPEATELLKGTKIERRLGAGIALGGYDDAGLTPARIQLMDEMGIDVQAVSINSFWYSADHDLASKLIDLQNQKLAEMCAAHPDRFVAFASVALQFPELAAQQLEVGMKKYGLRGAAIGGSCEGKELSSPEFDPFWAKAEELQALIFIHPQDSPNATGIKNRVQGNGVLTNVIGNPLETTICLSHLIMEGTLDKFPNLKIWFSSKLRRPNRSGMPRVSATMRENNSEEAVGILEADLCRYDRFQSGGLASLDRCGRRGTNRFGDGLSVSMGVHSRG
jgi:aminocarboxymuconate-semialdehyde decarboxylase